MKKIVITLILFFLTNINNSNAVLEEKIQTFAKSCILAAYQPKSDHKFSGCVDHKLLCYVILEAIADTIEAHAAAGLSPYACNIDVSKEDIRKKFIKFYYVNTKIKEDEVEISFNGYMYSFFRKEYPCKIEK